MQIQYHSKTIWTIANFLSAEDCEDLILFSEQKGYTEASVSLASGPKMIKGIRNNYRLMYQDEQLAHRYWEHLKTHCPKAIDAAIAVGLNEQFRFYKYEKDQRFKKHIDGRFKRNEKEESRITFMIYLNDDFEGGQTCFEDITIHPQQGMALCFIHEQKHESFPIRNGVKYVLRTDVMYKKR